MWNYKTTLLIHSTSIQVTVAIDFTSSNGNPSDPRSLHYSDEHQESTYVRAIKQIVPILEEYDRYEVCKR